MPVDHPFHVTLSWVFLTACMVFALVAVVTMAVQLSVNVRRSLRTLNKRLSSVAVMNPTFVTEEPGKLADSGTRSTELVSRGALELLAVRPHEGKPETAATRSDSGHASKANAGSLGGGSRRARVAKTMQRGKRSKRVPSQ